MSRHARTRRPAPDAEHPSLALQRPARQGASPAPSHDPAHHAGHDFRRVSVFPAAAVQRKGDGGAAERGDVPVAAGGGEAIPDSVRAAMEGAFAQDFGGVRVHTGPEAKRVGALAYTRGSDLHFQPGRYDPFSDTGRSLLGHELAHVVQQRAGRVAAPSQSKAEGSAPINADAGLEAEADAQGAKAARGERAHVSGAGSGVQRKGEDAPIQRLKLDDPQNLNQYVQGDVEGDVPFRQRMSQAMTQQSQMLANNDALPLDVNATAPTIPNPKGYASFQMQMLSEREKELDSLRRGKTNELTPNGGTITSEGAPNLMTPRPLPVKTALPDHFPVTQGTTEGSSAFKGGKIGEKISTLTGGDLGPLENKIQNPSQSPTLRDHQNHLKFPREGLLARQTSIMKTAKKSDPLMRELDQTNTLSHHVDKNRRLNQHGELFNGDRVVNKPVIGNTLTDGGSNPYYAVGATQFTNAQKLLPQLTGPIPNAPNVNNEMNSRRGLWSEADVDPVHVNSHGNNAYGHWANLGNRNAERLLHTASTSTAKVSSGRGGSGNDNRDYVSRPIDYRYQITNDHYKSAVPISPLQQNYATNHPYNWPNRQTVGSNSLEGKDTMDRERLDGDNSDHAKATNLLRNTAQQTRDLNETDTKQKASELNLSQAVNSSLSSNEEHNQSQERRDLAEIETKANATKDVYAEAESSARASSLKREKEEEERTQSDLKRFAPSQSIQAMYGMGKGGVEKWASQQMEQQHLGVQDFLKTGESEPIPEPMSENVKSMYY